MFETNQIKKIKNEDWTTEKRIDWTKKYKKKLN